MPNDMEKLKMLKEQNREQEKDYREEGLTKEERINRLFAPAICGSQAWLDRSTTWKMKREKEEREIDERKQEKEQARELEKERERQREKEKR
jgi:hypothetical protein